MISDSIIRKTFVFSIIFNITGALLFLFPSKLGVLFGLPTPVPFVYSGFCALVILLFGGTYIWLARSEKINEPVVLLSAIGKAGFFVVALMSCIKGETSFQFLPSAAGDLVMAGIFIGWLMNSKRNGGQ